MKNSKIRFEVSYGYGPISKQPYVKFLDGDYERMVPLAHARGIAKSILQACERVEATTPNDEGQITDCVMTTGETSPDSQTFHIYWPDKWRFAKLFWYGQRQLAFVIKKEDT